MVRMLLRFPEDPRDQWYTKVYPTVGDAFRALADGSDYAHEKVGADCPGHEMHVIIQPVQLDDLSPEDREGLSA